ncbi:ferredoxin--NADP reductase [Sessilibacter corallicola]|uniref:ferredoxin--NADP(+) reductase n=1 Tax=Sessilibacter corallicola TaxID=2904075 RepID=A0ABQ0AD38_9GAMM|nr:ferredoxin--NADP reductase [Sessilibacter corallicola]MCE2027436.1 ferredoxin--NADP reductase [Sessilibacter corallicola]
MANLVRETVTYVHHWNESLFSFRTTRQPSFRFENGHFVMLGLMVDEKPLMRAYSITSANYQSELEFFSIKVPNGPLTSKLQNIRVGDEVIISTKPTGTLISEHLLPGKRLYLLSTGTGLAPFLSIIRDPFIYEKFETVVLVHGVRFKSDLAYQDLITKELKNDNFLGELIENQLLYYPTVTRESAKYMGRIPKLLTTNKIFQDLGLANADPEHDRFMICGSQSMLKDTCEILSNKGFIESRHGQLGHFVIERAFVEQ